MQQMHLMAEAAQLSRFLMTYSFINLVALVLPVG